MRSRKFSVCILGGICATSLAVQLPRSSAQEARQNERPSIRKFAETAHTDAPIILCIDDKATSGGQPTDHAYAKAAANGFRSVLTFRSSKDGVDPLRERLM